MDSSIIPVLFLMTLLAVLIFAMVSKARTQQRKRDPNAPISTLAKDGKFGGVGFLVPPDQRQRRDDRKDSAEDNLDYERSEG